MPRVEYETSSPGWVQFLIVVLKTSGVAAVIALVLVYFLMQTVTNNIKSLSNQVQANHDILQAAQTQMHAFSTTHVQIEEERARQYSVMIQVLRQMCVNSADSPAARAGCYVEK